MSKEMTPEAREEMTLAFAELRRQVQQRQDAREQRRSQNASRDDNVRDEPNGSDPTHRDHFLTADEWHSIDEDRFSLDDIDLDDEDSFVLHEVEYLSEHEMTYLAKMNSPLLTDEQKERALAPRPKKPSPLFSIINSDSTFNFIRKKSANKVDNFDTIKTFYEEGRHIKKMAFIGQDKLDELANLKARFPNFGEVIDFIAGGLELKMIGNRYIRFEPIYLYGEPGIGKTEFVSQLAGVLGTGLEKANAATLTGTFSLSGSEAQWADSAPGIVSRNMMKNEYANFIFYLDEMEKAQSNGNGGYPLNALFDLLEEQTAKTFVDLAYTDAVLFNASAVNFIGAGNGLTGIHPAIVSRFNVFKIPSPTFEQMKTIVVNVHHSLLEKNYSDWGHFFSKDIDDCVVSALVEQEGSVRNAKKILKRAYVKAHKEQRNTLIAADVVNREQESLGRPMGFY